MHVRTTQSYDDTFREEALALLKRSGRSMYAIARDLGVPAPTLRNWYNNALMAKHRKKAPPKRKALPVSDPGAESDEDKLARLERENAALRKKVDELEMDRAILKKAAAFFAKESE